MATTSSTSANDANQANLAGRASLKQAYPVLDMIGSPAVMNNPALGVTLVSHTVSPRPVGVLQKFIVRVEADITVPAGCSLTPGPFGPAALLSLVQFKDLNSVVRISTSGIHLALLASARGRHPAGSATMTDTPLGWGNVIGGGISMPDASQPGNFTVSMTYEVPIMYGSNPALDARGAVFLASTNASAFLTLTLNGGMFVPAGSDDTNALFSYSGDSTPVVTQARITPYQRYYDQYAQMSDGTPILPWLDMQNTYQLESTTYPGITPNTDFQIPFANLRQYMSQFLIFNNGGTLNPGTDVNNFKLMTAGQFTFFNVDPKLHSYITRASLGDDAPLGTYYFPFRGRPVQTAQWGNTNMLINASQVNSNALVYGLSEFFGSTSTIQAQAIGGAASS